MGERLKAAELQKKFRDSGAQGILEKFGRAAGRAAEKFADDAEEELERRSEWEKVFGPLRFKVEEELRRGRDEFVLEVTATDFPQTETSDFDRVPLEVEEGLVARLPVRCIRIDHRVGAVKSFLTLQRVPMSSAAPPSQS